MKSFNFNIKTKFVQLKKIILKGLSWNLTICHLLFDKKKNRYFYVSCAQISSIAFLKPEITSHTYFT